MDERQAFREKLKAEAIDWLIRLDSESADLVAFEAWRQADPRHAAMFAQIAAVWKSTGDIRLAPDLQEAAARAEGVERASLNRRRFLIGTVAAGAGIVLAGGALMMRSGHQSADTFVETGIGERRTLALVSGSSAELNTDSRIEISRAKDGQLSLVRGEVALIIAQKVGLPFILTGGGITARLGEGRYNMRLRGAGVELIAAAGEALVDLASGMSRVLGPGDRLIRAAGETDIHRLSDSELTQALAWRKGEIIFNGMQLGEALEEFNRYQRIRIVYEDPQLASVRLGGRFETDDPESFLLALEDSFDIRHRTVLDRVLIYPGPDSVF